MFRSALRIALGTAGGQFIVLASMPLLTRLFAPEEFGRLALVTALSALIGSFIGLRLDLAIARTRDTAEAKAVGLSSVIAASILTAPVSLFAAFLYNSFSADRVSDFEVLTCAVSAALVAVSAVAIRWLAREQSYGTAGGMAFTQGGLQVGAQFLLSGSTHGLLAGLPAGRAPYLFILLWMWSRSAWPSLRQCLSAVRRYRSFALVSSWGGLLNACGIQAPAMLIAAGVGAAAAGTFYVAQRVLVGPALLVSQALSEVSYSEWARHVLDQRPGLHDSVRRLVRRLTLLGIGPFALAAGVVPFSIGAVLGPEWSGVGVAVAAMAPGAFAQFVAVPLSRTMLLLDRQPLQFAWELSRLGLTVAALLGAMTWGNGPVEVFLALSVAQVLGYGALVVLVLQSTRRFETSLAF